MNEKRNLTSSITWTYFLSPDSKNKKNSLWKKFLYFLVFQGMECSGPNIKKFLSFSQKKAFLIFQEMELSYISGNGNPKNLLIFEEVTFLAWKMKKKKVLYFRKWNFPAPSLKNFLYFRTELAKPEKQKFVVYWQRTFQI